MIRPFKERESYKWMVLFISFLLMSIFAISLQALPPMFEYITKDIPFSNSQGGALMGVYAIPGIFLPFLVAYLAKKLDIKKMILSALIIIIIGLLSFAYSATYLLLLLSRMITGIGATVLIILAPLLVTKFFDNKNMGIAMGIFNIAVPFGTVITANIAGTLANQFSWRVVIIGIAVLVGGILLVVFSSLTLPKDDNAKDINDSDSKQKFKGDLSLWLLGIIWAVMNAQMIAYVTFGSQFYQMRSLSPQKGTLLTSFIMLISIFLAPLVGVVIDKTGKKRFLLIIGSIIIAASFIIIIMPWSPLIICAILLGIGFTPIPVFTFSQLPEIVRPEQMAIGLGVLTIASNLGTLIGPAAFGSLLDLTEKNFTIGFLTLSLLSFITIFISLKIKPRQI